MDTGTDGVTNDLSITNSDHLNITLGSGDVLRDSEVGTTHRANIISQNIKVIGDRIRAIAINSLSIRIEKIGVSDVDRHSGMISVGAAVISSAVTESDLINRRLINNTTILRQRPSNNTGELIDAGGAMSRSIRHRNSATTVITSVIGDNSYRHTQRLQPKTISAANIITQNIRTAVNERDRNIDRRISPIASRRVSERI